MLIVRHRTAFVGLSLVCASLALSAADQPAVTLAGSAQSALPGSYADAARTEDGRIQLLVELDDAPAAVAWAAALDGSAPGDARARAEASSAARARLARISSEQTRVAAALSASSIGARIQYRVSRSFNGIAIAVNADAATLARISAIPGVRRVLPLYPETPTNSSSVPFLGTPQIWANTIGLPAAADGTGMRIGIIDTGVDYMHSAFGGTGVLVDYQSESTDTAGFTTLGTATAGAFPTAKVVGGYDFAGDAYTGTNAATPDVNPMDCNGHGSHVAGTAAGFGVNADGTTFAGPYTANPATYTPLRIGPGTAPRAQVFGLRVFGCSGSTTLTIQAIDWAIDPDDNGDFSDRLDVINMSLGSSFGSGITATAVAADNAALAGVVVVASAGNSGDTFFISGSPGSGGRVIATAASVDSGVTLPSVRVNAPGSVTGNYLGGGAAFGPAPTGQTANVVIALDPANVAGPLTTDGCTALTNAAAVAGNIALIDRGTCSFTAKVANAQAAGAIGVLIANNAPTAGSTPPGMAGVDPTITIPAVMISLADANVLRAAAGLNATLQSAAAGDTLASFSSRGPRRIAGTPLRLKPDIAAPGFNITSVQTGRTCTVATGCTGVSDPSGFVAGNLTLNLNGTSMASPHMAGIMALLRQLKPTWTVEELKALAMNYAIRDVTLTPGGGLPRFKPSRIGSGRVDPPLAAVADVIAMNADEAGAVSIAFEPEVTGAVTQVKNVRLVNKGSAPRTFDLGLDNTLIAPGVSFSIPGGSSVTVPANGTLVFPVQMSANRDQMDSNRDPALSPLQGIQGNYGDQPRQFLSEAQAYLTFSQGGNLSFRLPLYMAEKPASQMSAADVITTGGAPSGSTTLPLSGSGLCTGTLAAGPTCNGSFPTDIASLVTPLELQVASPQDPTLAAAGLSYADIQYAGVSYIAGSPSNINNDLIVFGVSSHSDWSTFNEVSYNICVDTNEDGVFDRAVINTVPSIFVAGASPNDNAVRVVQNLPTGGFTILGTGSFVNLASPAVLDTGLHLNNVMFLSATPAQLGMTAGDTTFRYRVSTCPQGNAGCTRQTTGDLCSAPAFFDQASGPYFWNWAAQGLNFNGSVLAADLPGATLPVSWNTANMTTNGSLGALLLHHHNARGSRAEVAVLQGTAAADAAVAIAVSAAAPDFGQNVTVTLTASNNGSATANGVSVLHLLPTGLVYQSDNGAGAYNSATGVWTVGTLVNAASATLQIVARVDSTDTLGLAAQISATTLDPNPVNNTTSTTLRAPRSANLALSASVSAPTVITGNPVTYTVTVTNQGVDPAYSLNINEAFPAFPTLNPTSFTVSQGGYTPATGVWNLASLGSGASATLSLVVTTPNMAGPLTLQASGSSNVNDPNTANNSTSATTTVLSPALVGGSKTVAGTYFPGSTVTYTITLNNTAATPQQDNPTDEFVDVLPPALTLVSASASSGTAVATLASNTVTWNGSIAAGGSVTITITATLSATAADGLVVSNQGTANYDADGNGSNESTALTDDPAVAGSNDPTRFTVIAQANLALTLVDTPDPVNAGTALTLNASVSNAGPIPADAVTVTLPVPAGTSFASGSVVGGGTCTAGANIVCSYTGQLAVGATRAATIILNVAAGQAQGSTISSTASVSSSTVDPVSANNSASASTAVVSAVDLALTLTDAPDPVAAGTALTYTATLSNSGPSDAAGVTLTLPLPAGTTLASSNVAGGGSCAGAPLVCSLTGTVAAGGSRIVTITLIVGGAIANGTTLTATATAGTTSTDANPANNSATASTLVNSVADLQITLSATPTATTFNVPVAFTASALNAGPSAAQNVAITLTLSPDLRYASHTATGASCTTPQVGTTGVVTCTYTGATAAGTTRVLDVSAYSNTEGSSTVSASVSSPTADPVPNNNASSVSVAISSLVEEIPALGRMGLLLLTLLIALIAVYARRER